MKFDKNDKYATISAYAVGTFVVCLVIAGIINNLGAVGSGFSVFFSAISPIIWGIIIAYLLNPIMVWSEEALSKITGKNKPHPKLNRILATVISVIFLFAVLVAVISIIIPQVYESIMSIVNNFETYMKNIENWINGILTNYPDILKFIDGKFDDIRDTFDKIMNDVIPKLGDVIVKIKDGALGAVSVLSDFVIGIIVAVYFLFDKERFIAQGRKVICAVVPKKYTDTVFRIFTLTNRSMSGFISGKIIDSIIIGLLCMLCMTVLHFNYALLISVIVGITNIIPVFGPIFGAIPGGLLLLLSSPKQVIPFVVLIVVIQQLDGNVIGPKILGNTTGLSAFWVLFAILVGGDLFGVPGMLLGVPIFAVVYSLAEEVVNYALKKKGLSCETADYAAVPRKRSEKNKDMKSFKLYKKDKSPSDDKPEVSIAVSDAKTGTADNDKNDKR